MEKLTFGNLKIGEKFISFPEAGDNKGHGGFKNPHYLFEKTNEKNAKRVKDENISSMPEGMYVILIQ